MRRFLLDAAGLDAAAVGAAGRHLCVVRYGIFSYWINSYWGGAVAATGGALLLGSLPRLRRQLTWQQGILFALGLVVLANSRPFEGFLFACRSHPRFLWLCFALATSPAPIADASCGAGLAVAGAGHGLDALLQLARHRAMRCRCRTPINQATYHISKPFLFQKPYPIPKYHNPQMRTFYMFHEYPDLLRSHSVWGIEVLMGQKFSCYYVFLVWPLLLLFVPGLMLAARSPELRVVFFAILLLQWASPCNSGLLTDITPPPPRGRFF